MVIFFYFGGVIGYEVDEDAVFKWGQEEACIHICRLS